MYAGTDKDVMEENASCELNPMLIDHIIGNVFKRLSVQEVKNCVNVCKEWSNVGVKELRKRRSIILRNNPSNEEQVRLYIQQLPRGSTIATMDFVGLRLKEGEYCAELIKRFGKNLEELNISVCSVPSDFFVSMLKTDLPNLRKLKLQSIGLINCSKYGVDRFGVANANEAKDFNWILCRIKMSQLQDLTIFENIREDLPCVEGLRRPEHEFLPYDITILMDAFPNLRCLSLRVNVRPPATAEILDEISERCNWSLTLKSIKIQPIKYGSRHLDMKVFDSLARMTLGIEKMTLEPFNHRKASVSDTNDCLDHMENFIWTNASAIKELTVNIMSNGTIGLTTFLPVPINNVTSFKITDNLLKTLDNLKMFKNLKHVEIQENDVGQPLKIMLSHDEIPVHEGVKSLKIFSWGFTDLGNLAKAFPNLQKLDLQLKIKKDETKKVGMCSLEKISKDFPRLKALGINANGKLGAFKDEHLEGLLFKGIEDLDIYPLDNITDEGIERGFCFMETLEYLNVSRSQITPDGLELLGQKLPNLKLLKMEKCHMISQTTVDEFQEKNKHLIILFSDQDNQEKYCSRFHEPCEDDHCKIICNCEKSTEVEKV